MYKVIFLVSALLFANVQAEVEYTLGLIKPDAVKAQHIGDILSQYEKNGLEIVALKMELLPKEKAQEFYKEHASRPFYGELVDYMISGPIVEVVLKGDDAVAKNRKLMGATDPKKAEAGTIRALYGKSIESNAVHGSDSLESAKREIKFFFNSIIH